MALIELRSRVVVEEWAWPISPEIEHHFDSFQRYYLKKSGCIGLFDLGQWTRVYFDPVRNEVGEVKRDGWWGYMREAHGKKEAP